MLNQTARSQENENGRFACLWFGWFIGIILPTDAKVVALPEIVIDGEVDGLLVSAVGGVVEAENISI